MNVEYRDLGLIDYKEAWDIQEELFDKLTSAKSGKAEQQGSLIFSQSGLLIPFFVFSIRTIYCCGRVSRQN
jgi:hypothetical protein